ncbi:hypothetical protein DL769_007845 [Monosporascus sp. CRB-8-3]|nr:hypothetical protein DL769_007845 [Monosporascus sp. CRB-8-3]
MFAQADQSYFTLDAVLPRAGNQMPYMLNLVTTPLDLAKYYTATDECGSMGVWKSMFGYTRTRNPGMGTAADVNLACHSQPVSLSWHCSWIRHARGYYELGRSPVFGLMKDEQPRRRSPSISESELLTPPQGAGEVYYVGGTRLDRSARWTDAAEAGRGGREARGYQ